MRYEQPDEGEWVQPRRKSYKLMCCDCGLVHRIDFRIYSGRIQFRAFRDSKATSLGRRGKPVWEKTKVKL